MRQVELLIKPVSHSCNLACGYCFYRKTEAMYPGKKHLMMPQTLDLLIRRAMEASAGGPCVFSWQGGEPSLAGVDFFRNAVALQTRYGRPGQSVTNAFQTNATLLSGVWASFFRQYRVLVGVSLDGPEHRHDVYRRTTAGTGSYARVAAAVKLLRREKVEFNILATIGKDTVGNAEDLYLWYVGRGLRYLQFIPAVDRRGGQLADFSVTPAAYGRFLRELFDAWWNKGSPLASVRFFDNVLEALIGAVPSSCTMKESCGSYLVIEANGDAFPCDFFVMPEWKLGNIAQTPLEELYALAHRRFGALKAAAPASCVACRWRFICKNGCLWFRWVSRGDMGDVDYLCEAYQSFFSYAIERLEALKEALVRDRLRGVPASVQENPKR